MIDQLQFLELSIPATDMQASLAWYRSIGFQELPTTDARPHRYAVVSNGSLCIGLHGDDLDAPGLTFVRRDLARFVLNLQEAGREFERATLGIDAFHEARQRDPDGSLLILLEARTFSPGQRDACAPGKLVNIALPCRRMEDSLEFWQRYGFIGVENSATGTAELHTPGLSLDLETGTRHLAVRLLPANFAACIDKLQREHTLRAFKTATLRGVELVAPEGTRVQLLEGDTR